MRLTPLEVGERVRVRMTGGRIATITLTEVEPDNVWGTDPREDIGDGFLGIDDGGRPAMFRGCDIVDRDSGTAPC